MTGCSHDVDSFLSEKLAALTLEYTSKEEQQEDVGQGERLCHAKRSSKPETDRLKCVGALRNALLSTQVVDTSAAVRHPYVPLKSKSSSLTPGSSAAARA